MSAVSLASVGVFGEGRKLRALWAGVEANDELIRLHDKVEQAVVRAGRQPESRKFRPHVSLARFKNNGTTPAPDTMQHYLSEYALFKSKPFTVGSFTLFSSFLSSSGAIYRSEADYPLDRLPASDWTE